MTAKKTTTIFLALLLLAALACVMTTITGGTMPTPAEVTATFGAGELHVQLTAAAEEGDCVPYPCLLKGITR